MKTETFECVICMALVAMDICLLGIQLHLSSIKKLLENKAEGSDKE